MLIQRAIQPGDSGALVVEGTSLSPLGLVIACSTGFAYMIPLNSVFSEIDHVLQPPPQSPIKLPDPFSTFANLAHYCWCNPNAQWNSPFLDLRMAEYAISRAVINNSDQSQAPKFFNFLRAVQLDAKEHSAFLVLLCVLGLSILSGLDGLESYWKEATQQARDLVLQSSDNAFNESDLLGLIAKMGKLDLFGQSGIPVQPLGNSNQSIGQEIQLVSATEGHFVDPSEKIETATSKDPNLPTDGNVETRPNIANQLHQDGPLSIFSDINGAIISLKWKHLRPPYYVVIFLLGWSINFQSTMVSIAIPSITTHFGSLNDAGLYGAVFFLGMALGQQCSTPFSSHLKPSLWVFLVIFEGTALLLPLFKLIYQSINFSRRVSNLWSCNQPFGICMGPGIDWHRSRRLFYYHPHATFSFRR
jgi:hypothetical protein